MSMYNLIKFSDNYSKIFGSMWQYGIDKSSYLLTDSDYSNPRIK